MSVNSENFDTFVNHLEFLSKFFLQPFLGKNEMLKLRFVKLMEWSLFTFEKNAKTGLPNSYFKF